MPTFEIITGLSEREYVQSHLDHQRRVTRLTVLVLAGCLITGAALENAIAIFVAVCGAIGLVVALFVVAPRQARTVYREQHSAAEARTIRLYEDRFEVDQPSGSFRSGWEKFVAWGEGSTTVRLYINRAMYIPVAKSGLGDAATRYLKERLVESGIPRAGKH